VGDRAAGQQRPDQGQGLVGTAAALVGVDLADLELVRVLAADADAEDQPRGRQLGDGRELARDQDRVPEGEQVDPGLDDQAVVGRQQRRGLDQPVGTAAVVEGDVVAHHHAVEPGAVDPVQQPGQPAGVLVQVVRMEEEGDAEVGHSVVSRPAIPATVLPLQPPSASITAPSPFSDRGGQTRSP
jgi:hypothetical protein